MTTLVLSSRAKAKDRQSGISVACLVDHDQKVHPDRRRELPRVQQKPQLAVKKAGAIVAVAVARVRRTSKLRGTLLGLTRRRQLRGPNPLQQRSNPLQ